MDGFIYQQVLSSEVSDLMNMSKEVYELHDDNTESLVDGIVNESSTYGIEVGFLDELEAKAMFLGINKGLGLSTNEPGLGLPTKEEGINAYSTEDFDAMLHTLDVAMDELNELHNHSRMDDYYEIHMNQLDNIINLINKLR
jgi:hypothetical protein